MVVDRSRLRARGPTGEVLASVGGLYMEGFWCLPGMVVTCLGSEGRSGELVIPDAAGLNKPCCCCDAHHTLIAGYQLHIKIAR